MSTVSFDKLATLKDGDLNWRLRDEIGLPSTPDDVAKYRGFIDAVTEKVPSDGTNAVSSLTNFLARAASLGVRARFPIAATYTMLGSQTVFIPDGTVVDAHPNAVFDISGMVSGTAGFTAQGSEAVPVNLTANVVAGVKLLTVGAGNASTFGANDWIRVCSDTYFAGAHSSLGGVDVFRGERVQVASSDNVAGTVTLLTPVEDSYPTSDVARISKISPVSNILWTGGRIIGGGNTKNQAGLILDRVVYARIDIRVDFCEDRGVGVMDSQDVFVYMRGDGGGTFSTSTFYGITFNGTCQDCTASGDIRRYKHAVSLGRAAIDGTRNGICRRLKYLNGTAIATASTGLDAHSGCIDLLVSGWSVHDPGTAVDDSGDVGGGISIRCPDATIVNNRVRRTQSYGVWARNQSTDPTDWTISDNRISRCVGIGIEVDIHPPTGTGETTDGLIVSSNNVVRCGDDGIKIFGNATSGIHQITAEVIGNTSNRNTGYGIHLLTVDESNVSSNNVSHNTNGGLKFEDCDNNSITSNVGIGDTVGKGIYLLTGCTSNIITDNQLVSFLSGIQADAGTAQNIIGPNQITNCTTPLVDNGLYNAILEYLGESLDWMRFSDIETVPFPFVANTAGTLASGQVYGVVARVRKGGTYTKIRVRLGSGTPVGITAAKAGVWDLSTNALIQGTSDFNASVIASAIIDATLDSSVTVSTGDLIVLGVVFVGATPPQVKGLASISSLASAARNGAGMSRTATGWVSGALPSVTATPSGAIPSLGLIP